MSENKNMRELSLDEMDKVSGGGECFDCQRIRTLDDCDYYVYTFIASMEKSFGKDAAVDFVKSQLPSPDIEQFYGKGNLDTLHNLLAQKYIHGYGVH